jgi:hypothetical protein
MYSRWHGPWCARTGANSILMKEQSSQGEGAGSCVAGRKRYQLYEDVPACLAREPLRRSFRGPEFLPFPQNTFLPGLPGRVAGHDRAGGYGRIANISSRA